MIKLSGKDVERDVSALVESRTPQIRAAAQRLHEGGFVIDGGDGPLIMISAIDLD